MLVVRFEAHSGPSGSVGNQSTILSSHSEAVDIDSQRDSCPNISSTRHQDAFDQLPALGKIILLTVNGWPSEHIACGSMSGGSMWYSQAGLTAEIGSWLLFDRMTTMVTFIYSGLPPGSKVTVIHKVINTPGVLCRTLSHQYYTPSPSTVPGTLWSQDRTGSGFYKKQNNNNNKKEKQAEQATRSKPVMVFHSSKTLTKTGKPAID
ncbi:hypothetical protein STEG23_000777 [Scotinomys teguina]